MNKKIFKFSIIAIIAMMVFVLLPASSVDAGSASYSGTNVGGPVYDRPSQTCGPGITNAPYHAQAFWVDTAGTYDFDSVQDYDGYMHLFSSAFDPANPLATCLIGDDDGFGGIGTSNFSYALNANETYWLVMAGFAAATGNFTNTITGIGNVTLGPFVPVVPATTMNIPNNGLVLINSWEPTVAYDSPGGNPITLGGGVVLVLPHDADASGYDTYVVTEITTVDDVIWVGLFLGNEVWGYVPWSAVHPASYFPE